MNDEGNDSDCLDYLWTQRRALKASVTVYWCVNHKHEFSAGFTLYYASDDIQKDRSRRGAYTKHTCKKRPNILEKDKVMFGEKKRLTESRGFQFAFPRI